MTSSTARSRRPASLNGTSRTTRDDRLLVEAAMAGEIIGRREELLAIEAMLDALPIGGQALLLEGDAGIGKSALWQEGLRIARDRNVRRLTARAARAETQIAFATVGDVFGPVLADRLPQLVPV